VSDINEPTAKAERNCALSHFGGGRRGAAVEGGGGGPGGMGRWLQVQPLTGEALSFCCRPLAVRSLCPARTVCPLCRALQRFTCACGCYFCCSSVSCNLCAAARKLH